MSVDPLLDRLRQALAGAYEVEGEVGAGGMATVFRARAANGGEPLAIKVLRPELGATLGVDRFLHEIEVLSHLDHPNILPLHDSGERAGLVYYVMPYVRGETLRERLGRERQLAVAEALAITSAVGEALAHAHERGILHRDVKPENILLQAERPLLTDFGIARAVDAAGGDRLTQTGFAMGTPAYMSPEQATGEASIDGRSDLYSLACVLFEMLAGEPPFTGATPATVLARRLSQDPPPLSAFRSALPAGLEEAVARALARPPADRTAGIATFLGELSEPEPVAADHDAGVAVLDFADLTGDPEIAWLPGGLAETLIADLRRAGAAVASRDRVGRELGRVAAGGEVDHLALGRALGVRWVVTGGIQKAGEALRVTCRAYDVTAAAATTAGKVDGTMREIFELQDQVARQALAALGVEAAGGVPPPPPQATRALGAWELYAKGRQLVKQFGPSRFGEARQFFEHAIALDPGYAPAHSGLGFLDVFSFIASTRSEELARGIAQLEQAVRLDDQVAEAHSWLTYGYLRQRRFEEAERAGRQAISLEPDSSQSHYFLGVTLAVGALEGRPWRGLVTGVKHLLECVRLDPTAQPGCMILAWLYALNGQHDEARAMADRATEIERSGRTRQTRFLGARTQRALLDLRRGEEQRARRALDADLVRMAGSDHLYAPFFSALARCGLAECAARRHDDDAAIEQAREALTLAEAYPSNLGMGYLVVRAHLLRATALLALGLRREAEAEAVAARKLFASRERFDFSLAWELGDALTHYELAALQLAAGRQDEALAALDDAFAAGWGDLPRLASDPGFERLRGDKRLARLEERVRTRGPLPVSGSSGGR